MGILCLRFTSRLHAARALLSSALSGVPYALCYKISRVRKIQDAEREGRTFLIRRREVRVVSETNYNLKGAIIAYVEATVIVEENRYLEIKLEITSENKTNQKIRLSDGKYFLPVKFAAKPKARELALEPIAKGPGNEPVKLDSELTAHHIGNQLEVEFNKGVILPPNWRFKWEISFETRGYFEASEDKSIIWGPYFIRPQRDFTGIPIEKHKFTYKFIFKKPKPKKWWLVKEIDVIQFNNKKTSATQDKKRDLTECTFAVFDVGPGEAMKIHFILRYRFSSVLIHILTTLAGMLIGALVHALLIPLVTH